MRGFFIEYKEEFSISNFQYSSQFENSLTDGQTCPLKIDYWILNIHIYRSFN
jgi:hypothetical protein